MPPAPLLCRGCSQPGPQCQCEISYPSFPVQPTIPLPRATGDWSYYPPPFMSYAQPYYNHHPHPPQNPFVPSTSAPVPGLRLSDSTNANTDENPGNPKKRKRATKNSDGSAASNKRTRTNNCTTTPALYGVGPSTELSSTATPRSAPPRTPHSQAALATSSPLASPSAHRSNGRSRSSPRKVLSTTATHVWHFMRPLHNNLPPSGWPAVPFEDGPTLRRKPATERVGCKLCKDTWSTFKTVSNTSGITRHLKTNHHDEWLRICREQNLKVASGIQAKVDHPALELNHILPIEDPFTEEGFYERLLRWIVVDDQAIRVVESPEFRSLIGHLLHHVCPSITLCGRTKLAQLVLEKFRTNREQISEELRNAEGRISITSDLWSDPNLHSFMAVTSHYLARNANQRLELRTSLIAFRYFQGQHSGERMAKVMVEILAEFDLLRRLGQISLDNASNNDTLMQGLHLLLAQRKIPFDANGNRIRCFPHIVNLAVRAIYDTLPSCGEINPVNLCRKIVTGCRASGQLREKLRSTIAIGRANRRWTVPQLQLLRDCDTRWSSTHNMITRVLDLWPAVKTFMIDVESLRPLILTDEQYNLLVDVQTVTAAAHDAQELLSAEKTPTVSWTLPLFLILIENWKKCKAEFTSLAPAVDAGIAKLEDYLEKMSSNDAYTLATVINPSVKLSWLQDAWPEKVDNATEQIVRAMAEFRTKLREKNGQRPALAAPKTAPLRAVFAQKAGISRMRSFDPTQRRYGSGSTPTPPASSVPSPATATSSLPAITSSPEEAPLTEAERQAAKAAASEQDFKDARREFEDYLQDGLMDDDVDMVKFWDEHSHRYPSLFRVALDILPAQASTVSSERVFSSSKHTCASLRNRLGDQNMERLQILKFHWRQQRQKGQGLMFENGLEDPAKYELNKDEMLPPNELDELFIEIVELASQNPPRI